MTFNEREIAMRKLIFTLMLLALPLMGGAAFAASDSGTVHLVNTRTGMLQLADGSTYYVPNRLTLSRLRKGDTVRVQFERRTGGAVADEVVRTGRSRSAGPVVTPTRGAPAVRKNFSINRDMCKVTATSNPCYIGAQ